MRLWFRFTPRAARPILAAASLLVLAGCASPEPGMAASATSTTTAAVDLGSSSRIPRIAGKFGEGEGYGTASQLPSMAHAQMPGMGHGAAMPAGSGPMDHASMPGMDHGPAKMTKPSTALDHRAMPGMDHSATGSQMAQADQSQVKGTGTVNSVDAAGRKVNLNHDAIPAIGWPPMTMDFSLAPSLDVAALKPGTRVDFTMTRGNDGMYVIQSITAGHGGH
jgi:Cu/Ag efflux protein CusF